MSELSELLGGPPPAGVAALPEHAQAELAGLIRAARDKQRDDLERSFALTLKHIPFPVRGIAKKMLLG